MNLVTKDRVFPRPFTHGRISPPPPPHMRETSAGGQSVNGGGTHEGGPNFDRLYHKLKVLLLFKAAITRCNLLATIVLKLVDLYLMAFKFAQ